jgi:hypothetical protein
MLPSDWRATCATCPSATCHLSKLSKVRKLFCLLHPTCLCYGCQNVRRQLLKRRSLSSAKFCNNPRWAQIDEVLISAVSTVLVFADHVHHFLCVLKTAISGALDRRITPMPRVFENP